MLWSWGSLLWSVAPKFFDTEVAAVNHITKLLYCHILEVYDNTAVSLVYPGSHLHLRFRFSAVADEYVE